ncbi:MAG TPA: Do family serine endopeptidase [Burkholderiales bacterium]|nr:Do family serine endopeptidase [Burkholderiales bacterium]
MRKLWLVFSQTATVCLALLFVVSTLRPDLLPWNLRGNVVTVREPHPVQEVPAARGTVSFAEAVRRAMPAVVNIYTSQEVKRPRHPLMDDPLFRYFFGDPSDPGALRREGLGSGVIVSEKGYILTNHHVIESVDQIEVALADGRKVSARVVGTDPETDLAVLKVELKKLPAIAFARAEELRVGDIVLAIGNPFGVGQTVTLGIVSALGRSHLGITTFENFIQTDAAINPGNSGGALVDANGNLVGINTAIFSQTGGSQGIGYAIPVSIARQVMEQIIEKGSVTRGWIGVGVQDLTRELAESFKLAAASGVLISQVERGGPAERAGVKPGDVLTTVNGKPVPDTTTMLNLIAALQPGQQARLKIVRNQQEIELVVTVGRRPTPQSRRPR